MSIAPNYSGHLSSAHQFSLLYSKALKMRFFLAQFKKKHYFCTVFIIRLVIAAFRKLPNLFRQQNASTGMSPPCAGYSSCFCWVFGDTLERRLK
jgi:hypothetical protein